MDNLKDLNIPVDVSWAPWILALVLVLGATAIIIILILRPSPHGNKLLGPLIGALVSLISATGGFLFRTPEVREKDVNLERAYLTADSLENALDKVLPGG